MHFNFHLSLLDQTTETTVEDSGNDDDGDDEIYPQSVIAISVLAGAMLIGHGIAKLVDVIHDRQSLRDDASDMSEYTRKLLKARVTVLAFKSAIDKEKEDKEEKSGRERKESVEVVVGESDKKKEAEEPD